MLLIGVVLAIGCGVGGFVGYLIGASDLERVRSENYDLRHRVHLRGENPDVLLRGLAGPHPLASPRSFKGGYQPTGPSPQRMVPPPGGTGVSSFKGGSDYVVPPHPLDESGSRRSTTKLTRPRPTDTPPPKPRR